MTAKFTIRIEIEDEGGDTTTHEERINSVEDYNIGLAVFSALKACNHGIEGNYTTAIITALLNSDLKSDDPIRQAILTPLAEQNA